MSGMAEVDILVEHVLLTSSNGYAACAAEDCPWEDSFRRADKYEQAPLFVRVAHADHQLELLAAAGFGPVKGEKRLMEIAALMAYDAVEEGALREAKAVVLEEAAEELARLPYVKPGAEGRDEYERILAVRRGDTDKWLKARASAMRGEGG